MEQGKIKYATAEFTPRGEVKEGTVTWHTKTHVDIYLGGNPTGNAEEPPKIEKAPPCGYPAERG